MKPKHGSRADLTNLGDATELRQDAPPAATPGFGLEVMGVVLMGAGTIMAAAGTMFWRASSARQNCDNLEGLAMAWLGLLLAGLVAPLMLRGARRRYVRVGIPGPSPKLIRMGHVLSGLFALATLLFWAFSIAGRACIAEAP